MKYFLHYLLNVTATAVFYTTVFMLFLSVTENYVLISYYILFSRSVSAQLQIGFQTIDLCFVPRRSASHRRSPGLCWVTSSLSTINIFNICPERAFNKHIISLIPCRNTSITSNSLFVRNADLLVTLLMIWIRCVQSPGCTRSDIFNAFGFSTALLSSTVDGASVADKLK